MDMDKYGKKFRQNSLVSFTVINLLVFSVLPFNVLADEYFNPELLYIGNKQQNVVDLSIFAEQGGQTPGTYQVDIYLNNQYIETRNITFISDKASKDNKMLYPCLSEDFLHELGVKTDQLSVASISDPSCVNLAQIPYATAELRFSTQQLFLSFPQASLIRIPYGYVNEKKWNEGINALMLNYSLTGAHNRARSSDSSATTDKFMSLMPGLNFGSWRLRNYTSYANDNNGNSHWNSIYTYAERNIISLKSQLILGESSSPNEVFDSIPFRGAQLSSDENMIPDSLRGYAPVVRGIAQTNAQVIIRQNGYIIYQSYVAPGPFDINDLYPTGGAGDLLVTIKEADGREQQMVIPFASLPILQREGQFKYSVTGGQYRQSDSSIENKPFTQLTAIYGLAHGFTTYGGGQFASDYRALSSGLGNNLGNLGAVSVDLTQAWATPKNQVQKQGQSWRIRYSKNIVPTGTNFSLAAYRYSTRDFYTLAEALNTYHNQNYYDNYYSGLSNGQKRNRMTLLVSQSLGGQAGSLSVNMATENYWDNQRTMNSIGASYNNAWRDLSYGVNYSYNTNTSSSNSVERNETKNYHSDQIFSLNLSIPFSAFSSTTYANYNMSSSQNGGSTYNLGLNGTALADKNLNWNIQQSYATRDVSYGGVLSTDYRGTYGEANAGYSDSHDSQRFNAGLRGSILVHQGGVTFGQPMQQTSALLHVVDGPDIRVLNHTGVKTDWRGYAIIPYATPYRKNQLQLDLETLPKNIELPQTTKNFTPTRGAIVQTQFNANVGERVLLTLFAPDNKPIPFGAIVTHSTAGNEMTAIVGDNSEVYLTGMKDRGTVKVKWGNHANQQCQASYTIPDASHSLFIHELKAICQ